MLKWAQTALSRRSLLGGGVAALGATSICTSTTVAQWSAP